jgi:hypothetical protein
LFERVQVARLLYEYEKDAEDAAPPPPLTARRGSGGEASLSANLPRPQAGYRAPADSVRHVAMA